ncbi:phage tail protein [Pseudomonas alkylphenolica]|uniref:Phage tail protein n=1 Tax=Pseudomonas alkylphenolica TaxID=237609 RepID=A0A6I6GTD9_9PSED|nr:phage tail assembly chaperone [Pseudomonas alkylphenolica]QGW77752.1 phage tail protein [Pseudomonas alkylphenolica]
MGMYYCAVSESRGGFFDTRIHGEVGSPGCSIPVGAKEVSDELYAELTAPREDGKLIYPDADGYPVLIDPPPPSTEELAAIERQWRDERLMETDGVVSRHRDELEEGGTTTLTAEQYATLQAYRRALRGWPQVGEFPLIDHRPTEPQWLTDSLQ